LAARPGDVLGADPPVMLAPVDWIVVLAVTLKPAWVLPRSQ
jgi:hypothetical protein